MSEPKLRRCSAGETIVAIPQVEGGAAQTVTVRCDRLETLTRVQHIAGAVSSADVFVTQVVPQMSPKIRMSNPIKPIDQRSQRHVPSLWQPVGTPICQATSKPTKTKR